MGLKKPCLQSRTQWQLQMGPRRPAGRQQAQPHRATTPSSPPAAAARSPPPIPPCFYAWQLAPCKPYLCAKCSVRAHTHGQRDPSTATKRGLFGTRLGCQIDREIWMRFSTSFFNFLQPSSCSELRAYSSEQLGIVALLAPMYQCLGPVHWKGCGS